MTLDSAQFIENAMPLLKEVAEGHPYPLIFSTISGAHLYGFASEDSDYDLRGVHRLPVRDLLGLSVTGEETVERSSMYHGLEMDLVTHDAKKFFLMLLRPNGYVLEQLLSPLVVTTSTWHEALKDLAPKCITRHHAHHYLGFAHSQWKQFITREPHRVKPLLYVFRVLLTGIYLMRTGEVEANLNHLNRIFQLPYLGELIRQKTEGTEKEVLGSQDILFFEGEFDRLLQALEEARCQSGLPEAPTADEALNNLLIQIRFADAP